MTDRKRPDWTLYLLGVADSVSMRADCTRRRVGAVVADASTKHIISTGYNGTRPGEKGCLAGACPRGRHYKTMNYGSLDYGSHCGGCKQPWPCPEAAVPGSSYDTGKNSCIAIHAEANALLRAGERARGNWLFVTDEPCDGCKRLVAGAGITKVCWYGGEWYPAGRKTEERTWLGRLKSRFAK